MYPTAGYLYSDRSFVIFSLNPAAGHSLLFSLCIQRRVLYIQRRVYLYIAVGYLYLAAGHSLFFLYI